MVLRRESTSGFHREGERRYPVKAKMYRVRVTTASRFGGYETTGCPYADLVVWARSAGQATAFVRAMFPGLRVVSTQDIAPEDRPAWESVRDAARGENGGVR